MPWGKKKASTPSNIVEVGKLPQVAMQTSSDDDTMPKTNRSGVDDADGAANTKRVREEELARVIAKLKDADEAKSGKERRRGELRDKIDNATDGKEKFNLYIEDMKLELDIEEHKVEIRLFERARDLLLEGGVPAKDEEWNEDKARLRKLQDSREKELEQRKAELAYLLQPPPASPVMPPLPEVPNCTTVARSVKHDENGIEYVVKEGGKRESCLEKVVARLYTMSGSNHISSMAAPVVIGCPGIGKTRLVVEAVSRFLAAVNREGDYGVVSLSLHSKEYQDALYKHVPADWSVRSSNLLAATLLFTVSQLDPKMHTYDLDTVMRYIHKHDPKLKKLILIIDEFSSDLGFSERIVSACSALMNSSIGTSPPPFRVLPILCGVNRIRVKAVDELLMGMEKRASGKLVTRSTYVHSLEPEERKLFIERIAKHLDVDANSLMSVDALGCFLDDCGGWPAILMNVRDLLKAKGKMLESLKLHHGFDSQQGELFFNQLVDECGPSFDLSRFLEALSSEKRKMDLNTSYMKSQATKRDGDTLEFKSKHLRHSEQKLNEHGRPNTGVWFTLVLHRLVVVAMAGIPVKKKTVVLLPEEAANEVGKVEGKTTSPQDFEGVGPIYFESCDSIFEVVDKKDDEQVVRLNAPLVAILAVVPHLQVLNVWLKVLNPYVNDAYTLEKLAMISIFIRFLALKYARHEGTFDLLDTMRPGALTFIGDGSKAGRRIQLKVPENPILVQFADDLKIQEKLGKFRTGLNAKGDTIDDYGEGMVAISAQNQAALDGVMCGQAVLPGVNKTEARCLWLSQEKDKMVHVPQTGKPSRATLTIGDVDEYVSKMRDRAKFIAVHILHVNNFDDVIVVYDIFTTQLLGKQLREAAETSSASSQSDRLDLLPNEYVYITTEDCVRQALGPTLGSRATMKVPPSKQQQPALAVDSTKMNVEETGV